MRVDHERMTVILRVRVKARSDPHASSIGLPLDHPALHRAEGKAPALPQTQSQPLRELCPQRGVSGVANGQVVGDEVQAAT